MADKNRKKDNEKYSPQMKQQAIMLYCTNGSYTETAKALGVAISTAHGWINSDENKEMLENVRKEKLTEFTEKAGDIINKGLALLDRRITTALDRETELDDLIDEIWATDKGELAQDQKQRLVAKIQALQIQRLGEITTAVGTLYDKRALAQGDPTQRIDGFEIVITDKK